LKPSIPLLGWRFFRFYKKGTGFYFHV